LTFAKEHYPLKELLPSVKSYFTYDGSLTTPPCSEPVQWMIATQPIEASAKQIKALEKIVASNNRPIQETGARVVTKNIVK
jgi:carbonic anhydrase